MRPIVRSVLQILASGAVIVLACAMLLVFAEGIASFGVGRTTAAEISFGLLILGSFIVYVLTARR
jgi:hypothetical protein